MQSQTEFSAEYLAHHLYQALAASGHAAYCPAHLGPLYDEEEGRWGDLGHSRECTCGRDSALAKYEAWRASH